MSRGTVSPLKRARQPKLQDQVLWANEVLYDAQAIVKLAVTVLNGGTDDVDAHSLMRALTVADQLIERGTNLVDQIDRPAPEVTP